jgi:ABC-type phosphate transport system substrate-binding protein
MSARPIRGPRLRFWWVAAFLLLSSAACSFILHHDSSQCDTDTDCEKFGSHPWCQNGVCVSSGLGPPACTYFPPSAGPVTPDDFRNQCSTAACDPFDDCVRLQVCGDAGPPLVTPEAGAPASPVDAGNTTPTYPNCVDPTAGRTNVVFINGSSTWPPLMKKLAPIVIANGGPVPVFQTTSSCGAVGSIYNSTPMVDPSPGSSASYAQYYGPDGTAEPCLLGSAGVPVDIGASDVYSASCGFVSAAGATDHPGAIQAIVFVVPSTSSQTAISAEAAREVFGLGGNDGGTKPWIDPTRYFVRNASAGSQQMIARAIQVPPNEVWGQDQGTATKLVSNMELLLMSQANPAIGFVSVTTYDPARGKLQALAYQDWDQDCAYLPDSTKDSMDKQNVRDGHYPIWGPIHFLTPQQPSDAAATFLQIVALPVPTTALVNAYVASSMVPTCAMGVQRAGMTDLGPLSAYTPPVSCGCYFDSITGGAPVDCLSCTSSAMCPSGRTNCNLGYCEVE